VKNASEKLFMRYGDACILICIKIFMKLYGFFLIILRHILFFTSSYNLNFEHFGQEKQVK